MHTNKRDDPPFAAGEYYHVYNRGTGKMRIYHDDADYAVFKNRLREYLHPKPESLSARPPKIRGRKSFPPGAFSLIAYCLMPNHYHLLIRQNTDLSLSELMHCVGSSYSRHFNDRYTRVGAVFQDQFKAVHVDTDRYLRHVSAYIHQNPRVAGMVSAAEHYPHSSYQEYLQSTPDLCETRVIMELYDTPRAYKRFTEQSAEGALIAKSNPDLLIDR